MTLPKWEARPTEFLFDRRAYSVPIYEQSAPEGDKLPCEAYGSTKELATRRAQLVAAAPVMRAALAEFGRLPITRRRVLELGVIFADAIAASEGR